MSLISRPRRVACAIRGRSLRVTAIACALTVALGAGGLAHAGDQRTFHGAASDAVVRAWSNAQEVTVYALSLIGVKYRFGGNTPDSGLDCSGLVRYVFQEVTGVTLPRTSREMSGVGEKVGVVDLMPGDLVFFNTRRFANSHVGIYLGDNRFIHAPSKGGDVEIATMSASYWKKRFNGARRLLAPLPALAPSLVPSVEAAPLPSPWAASAASASPMFQAADLTP